MPEIELKVIRKPSEGTQVSLPKKATDGSVGFDLFAAIAEPLTIRPYEQVMVPSGVAIALPGSGYAALVFARSGLASRYGVTLSNGVGVIDSDYRGEIIIALSNISERAYTIKPGERIAQLVVVEVPAVKIVEVAQLEDTARSAGGFGSTGKF